MRTFKARTMMEQIHGSVGSPAVSLLDISRNLFMLKGLMWRGFPVAKRISMHRQKLHVVHCMKSSYSKLCTNVLAVICGQSVHLIFMWPCQIQIKQMLANFHKRVLHFWSLLFEEPRHFSLIHNIFSLLLYCKMSLTLTQSSAHIEIMKCWVNWAQRWHRIKCQPCMPYRFESWTFAACIPSLTPHFPVKQLLNKNQQSQQNPWKNVGSILMWSIKRKIFLY